MVMFVEVHHLKPVELVRDSLDLFSLPKLDSLDSGSIPSCLIVSIGTRRLARYDTNQAIYLFSDMLV